MNAVLVRHEIDWLAPAPLWGMSGVRPDAPVVVRFRGDDFMDRFTQLLDKPTPDRAAKLLAAGVGVTGDGMAAGVLYQPLHGCYALVCASLTCRLPGRPEKAVAPAAGESVGFVLRRIEDGAEEAWVPGEDGRGEWKPADDPEPLDGEEVLPLFPVRADDDPPRRVWAGLVPTTSRETFEQPLTPPPPPDRRLFRPKLDPGPEQRYVVRCVYRRDGCPPDVSEASAAFAVAPLYDPDAPARTIRIPMPIDTSPQSWGKLKKNVGFLLSKSLNKQAGAFTGKFKDIDDGKKSPGEPAEGVEEICTFALPIITLCAMIVLFVFLVALNFVFFWLPFLKICLPLPKKEGGP